MELKWTARARDDRREIYDHIEQERVRTAITVDNRIEEQVDGLTRFPGKGRPGRVEGTRELVIQRTPFIAVYRIAGELIRVLRIIRGAQEWPKEIIEEPDDN